MLPLITLCAIVVLPVLVLFFIRSSASVVFLALCAGTVLLKYVGSDASFVLDSTFPRVSIVAHEVLNLSLVLVPAVTATVLLRKSVSGPKAILNLLPAAAVGLLAALSVIPLISVTTRNNIMHTSVWSLLEQMEGFVVGCGVLVSLLMLKSAHKKSDSGHKKGRK